MRIYLPPTCNTLSKQEKRQFSTILSKMKVPSGYSSNVQNLMQMKDLKLINLKSHDCHTLMKQLLLVDLHGVLPKGVRNLIIQMFYFFNAMCNKFIDPATLGGLHKDLVETLCLFEKYFPPSFFDMMVHLTVYLVRELKLCGPV